jgi:uncharacterized protein (TIGR00255 family)
MKSMTGFGLARLQTHASIIEVSLRSVNGRFLEPRFHLPREFISVEPELKKILLTFFDRGTIDIFVNRRVKPGVFSGQVSINRELARKYFDAYKTLARELKLRGQFHIESIARLPEVVKIDEHTELSSTEKKTLLATMKKACLAADKERKREGKSLRLDLERVLRELEKEVHEILSVREEANQNLLSRFEQKIKSRLSSLEVDSTRLSQEVVIQLEKSDINEEVTRLKEHIKNYGHLLSLTEPIGKKLDFYTQELLREVNTIGSKSGLSKLTQIVIQAKTLIERLREQVQNIE